MLTISNTSILGPVIILITTPSANDINKNI